MLNQMSGLPGAPAQSPVERAGRAVPASAPLPPSPPSAPAPCVRTGPATTPWSALVSALLPLSHVSATEKKECDLEKVCERRLFEVQTGGNSYYPLMISLCTTAATKEKVDQEQKLEAVCSFHSLRLVEKRLQFSIN